MYDRKPSVMVTSPSSPERVGHRQGQPRPLRSNQPNVGGRLQVKLWFDAAALQLTVTVAGASGLTPRPNGQPRNPYAKLFLLPDRRYACPFFYLLEFGSGKDRDPCQNSLFPLGLSLCLCEKSFNMALLLFLPLVDHRDKATPSSRDSQRLT